MQTKSVKWLTTLDLETFIRSYADKNTKSAFLGVFPINYLPKRLSHLPVFLIINTNTNNLPGQHWKAVFIDKKGNGEIFDSLAMPISLDLQRWMNNFAKKWTVSQLTLQNPLSPSCGGYVLLYIMTRLKCKSLISCVEQYFTSNVIENDRIVEHFFHIMLQ